MQCKFSWSFWWKCYMTNWVFNQSAYKWWWNCAIIVDCAFCWDVANVGLFTSTSTINENVYTCIIKPISISRCYQRFWNAKIMLQIAACNESKNLEISEITKLLMNFWYEWIWYEQFFFTCCTYNTSIHDNRLLQQCNQMRCVLWMKLVSVIMHSMRNLPVEQKSEMQQSLAFYSDFCHFRFSDAGFLFLHKELMN